MPRPSARTSAGGPTRRRQRRSTVRCRTRRPKPTRRSGRRSSARCTTWTSAGHADPRDPPRHDLHRFVHQQPHGGPARRRADRRRSQDPAGPSRARGPGVGAGEAAGGEGGTRPHLHRRRVRVARRRVFDVSGHEPGHPFSRRSQRVHVQSQLRRPSGQGRAHAPGESAVAAATAVLGRFATPECPV